MRSALLSWLVVLSFGCNEQKAAPPAGEAPAPKATAAVSAAAPPKTKKPATIASIAVAKLGLDDSKTLDAALKPLGYTPIMGCGFATVKGRSMKCVYGFHAVTVSLHDKTPRKTDKGYEEVYSYPNSVLLSDGKHVIVSAGFDGNVESAQAVVTALWDDKAKTFGGEKLRDLKELSDLRKPLETKGYVGNVLGSIDYTLRELEVTAAQDDGNKPEGTFYDDGQGGVVEVKISSKEGAAPEGEEKKVLEALTNVQ
jgi:hypothetical protein